MPLQIRLRKLRITVERKCLLGMIIQFGSVFVLMGLLFRPFLSQHWNRSRNQSSPLLLPLKRLFLQFSVLYGSASIASSLKVSFLRAKELFSPKKFWRGNVIHDLNALQRTSSLSFIRGVIRNIASASCWGGDYWDWYPLSALQRHTLRRAW